MRSFNFSWIIPIIIFTVFTHAHFKKIRVFEVFIEGAMEGLGMTVKLIPYLISIYVAVGIFRESGAIDILVNILSPILRALMVPTEAFFMSVVRSLSGPAALGMMMEIFENHGPDSYLGRLASVLLGSSDTTFYVVAVYFGSVGIKKPRYSVPVGLFADFASLVASIYITRKLFL